MAQRITAAEFESEVLAAEKPVLVDFYSDSCIPCKRLSPILTRLEEQFREQVKIVKVNILYEEALTEQYEIQAAPTLVLFQGGTEVNRLRGAVTADEIEAAIAAL